MAISDLQDNNLQGVNWIQLVSPGLTAAYSQIYLPVNTFINAVLIQETAGNAVTGGLKFGTTLAASDIANAVTVAANANVAITDAKLSKRFFPNFAPQQVFVDAVTGWNNANVNLTFIIGQLL